MPARSARTHDDTDLGNSGCRHAGLVVKDASKMIAVGKDLVLGWKEGSSGIDKINARQIVFLGDFLSAQVFLDGYGIIGAALDRGVIGEDHDFGPLNAAEARDDSSGRHFDIIKAVSGQSGKLQKRRAGVNQTVDAMTGQ